MPIVTLFLNGKVTNLSPFQKTFTVPEHEGIVGFTVTGTVILGIIPEPPPPPPNGDGFPEEPVNGGVPLPNGDRVPDTFFNRLLFGTSKTFVATGSTVSIKLNGVTEDSIYTTGGAVTFSFEKYIEGGNTIELTITAPDGYTAIGTFTAQMSYTEPPPPPAAPVIIDSSPDAVDVVEGANQYVFATATDIDPADYEIRVDGVLYDSGTWSSPTTLQYVCRELSAGNHTVSFYFSDQTGLFTTRIIMVAVEEAPPPAVAPIITDSTPGIVNITEGGYYFAFATAEDDNPSTYEVIVDGVTYEYGQWSSPTTLFYDCTPLSEGTHEIVFRFDDLSGLRSEASISAIVTAEENGEENGVPEWWEEIDVLWVVGGVVLIAGIGAAAWILLPK